MWAYPECLILETIQNDIRNHFMLQNSYFLKIFDTFLIHFLFQTVVLLFFSVQQNSMHLFLTVYVGSVLYSLLHARQHLHSDLLCLAILSPSQYHTDQFLVEMFQNYAFKECISEEKLKLWLLILTKTLF